MVRMASPEHIAELEAHYRSRGIEPGKAKGLALIHQDRPLAACLNDPAPILARLMAGESTKEVAESLGISSVSLFSWLVANAPEEWQAISAGKALARVEKAENDFDDENASQAKVNRAAQSARLATWQLERTARKLYGAPEKDGSGVAIQINVDRSCAGEIIVQSTQGDD